MREVDTGSLSFQTREYMIRLERADFEDEQTLKSLAEQTNSDT